jgi:ribosomal protein L11 methyltransferase
MAGTIVVEAISKGWNEIHLTAPKEQIDRLSDLLTMFGAEAITTLDAGDEPIFEPAFTLTPTWSNTTIIALFTYETDLAVLIALLETEKKQNTLSDLSQKFVANQDWERACLVDFKPMQFGKRLWICPSWLQPPVPEAVNIILDPGLAFGTGTHETTALCLEWLDQHIQPDMTVIDYGCGSGILAIAALKLGASIATCVDHDERALMNTRENALQNQISPQQLLTLAPNEAALPRVDVLIANILAQPLVSLAEFFASLVQPNGGILLSGILQKQAEMIISAYAPWFNIDQYSEKNGWINVAGIRKR